MNPTASFDERLKKVTAHLDYTNVDKNFNPNLFIESVVKIDFGPNKIPDPLIVFKDLRKELKKQESWVLKRELLSLSSILALINGEPVFNNGIGHWEIKGNFFGVVYVPNLHIDIGEYILLNVQGCTPPDPDPTWPKIRLSLFVARGNPIQTKSLSDHWSSRISRPNWTSDLTERMILSFMKCDSLFKINGEWRL
ncbi:U3 putative protein [Bangoran virus]|uniref:U3 putative protein n=1 Tax=Bangoran virus TaxID=864693 RepID=UPI0024820932|nr:U3 putative protein [Bangoran virus]UAX43320.1 U3 putative protein [Bangoran virus]